MEVRDALCCSTTFQEGITHNSYLQGNEKTLRIETMESQCVTPTLQSKSGEDAWKNRCTGLFVFLGLSTQ